MDEENKIPDGVVPDSVRKTVRPKKDKSEAFAELMKKKGIRQAEAEKEALSKQAVPPADFAQEIRAAEKSKPVAEIEKNVRHQDEQFDRELTNEDLEAMRIKSGGKGKKLLKIILVLASLTLVLGALGAGGYYYYQYKQFQSSVPPEKEAQTYVSRISRFAVLPDETPTVATVKDVEKLKDQAFFNRAQNGDKVLLFPQAKKAYLYRPSENKLIEVMTLVELQGMALPSASASGEVVVPEPVPPAEEPAEEESAEVPVAQKESVKVAVFNGTKVRGMAKDIGEKIATLEGISVSEVTNAKGDYAKTVIIDLTGNNEPFLKRIQDKIGGELGEMPAGETKPAADILIIGGSDYKK